MKEAEYYSFHKPAGMDFEREDDLIALNPLPKENSGLVIITNDKNLRRYFRKVEGTLPCEFLATCSSPHERKIIEDLRAGLTTRDHRANIKRLSSTRLGIVAVCQPELITKLAERAKNPLKDLRRLSYGKVKLGSLGAGNMRQLTKSERNFILGLI